MTARGSDPRNPAVLNPAQIRNLLDRDERRARR